MIRFSAELKRFDSMGEKTGWTYIELPQALANELQPGRKTSYRVKGRIDKMEIGGVALVPMGGGDFIIAINGDMRRKLRKEKGATVQVQLALDSQEFELPAYFAECFGDEPEAERFFNTLPPGHRRYFVRWVESAKTEPTRAKRLALMVNALARGWGYSEMIRAEKARKEKEGF